MDPLNAPRHDPNYPFHAPLHMAAKGCDLGTVQQMVEGGGSWAVWPVNVTANLTGSLYMKLPGMWEVKALPS